MIIHIQHYGVTNLIDLTTAHQGNISCNVQAANISSAPVQTPCGVSLQDKQCFYFRWQFCFQVMTLRLNGFEVFFEEHLFDIFLESWMTGVGSQAGVRLHRLTS